MSPALQAMQREDSQNPAMLAVQDGAALWAASPGAGARSCGDCHGEASTSMRGVAARYPAWDTVTQQGLNLAGRINACRQRHQRLPALPPDHADALGLAALSRPAVARACRWPPRTTPAWLGCASRARRCGSCARAS